MTNSTAACIHEEWDRDYHMAWDETAKRNAEFIAAANPAVMLALLDELEAKDILNAELKEKQRLIHICQGQGLEHRIAAEKRAEAAEKHIAELQARDINIKQQAQALFEAIANPDDCYIPAYVRCLREALNGNSAGTDKGE
ncbi:ead/Ea22-like family protein, partial [Huaxiibacter chinensis]|uniref:ead/Ea22-like family protein n=1 Tax=Huaxiibacter chinensis TaxID=2899785 RepID=UPI003D311C67